MTIKISQLANLTVTQANTIVPVVSNITGTLTTVQASVQQLQTYMQNNAGNLIPAAGNIYSIGNSTTWWKDLWLSPNTLYIGGIPMGISGNSLTFGGANVGTSELSTYTGNVSAGNIAVGATTVGNTTTAPTFSVEGSTGNISAGNIAVGATTVGNTITPATFSVERYTGNISAGNVFVYSVESDTISLTLPTSASDMLPSYDGGVILSTGTISTNLTTQYWGFNPIGVTWFTVASTTGIASGMQIYWAGYLIGTVTGVTSGNVSCTPLTATPNFVNGSPVSFGNPAPLYTDEVTASGGNLTITGNITNTGNVTVSGNITVLSWLKGPPTGNLNIGSPVIHNGNVAFLQPMIGPPGGNLVIGSPVTHNGNITVLQYLNGPPGGNLVIGSPVTHNSNVTVLQYLKGPLSGPLRINSDSSQAVNISANAGAKTWQFNGNGSVTFPDNTLQTSGYPGQLYGNVQVNTYLPTYNGNVGPIAVGGNLSVFGVVNAGFPSPLTFPGVVVNAVNDANSYVQLNIQNINTVGNLVSTDVIATAPNGTDSTYYIDMGINGNNWSSSSWTVSGANDGYVYINSGNLTLGTDTPNTTVKVHVGGTLAANVVATFSNSNVTIGGNLIVSNVYVPTANNSVGTRGQISYDSSYVYICIANNTWKRANISTW